MDYLKDSYNADEIGCTGTIYKGTIRPFPNFNAEEDCNLLRKAFRGLGTDENTIIECLSRRNLEQRLEIRKLYKTMFGKDLCDELKSELGGDFKRAVVQSLYEPDYYDAYSLHKAMKGLGTRENVLTEILASRSNKQIIRIKELYKKWFKNHLVDDVKSETSGFFRRVLISLLEANKKELTKEQVEKLKKSGPSSVIDQKLAKQEAQELYNAGEGKLGTDEACFIKVFAMRNRYQLKATFDAYKEMTGVDITVSIMREMSGDLASALVAMTYIATNPPLYFATRLYKSMHGLGTKDTDLIRLILSRSEIDLETIKEEFQKKYEKTLESWVKGDTSGDYRKFLLRIVEGN